MASGPWRTGQIRIDINGAGIRELLRSAGVADEIERRANLVAGAADARYAVIPVGARDVGGAAPDHIRAEVKMGQGPARARARVVAEHPAAPAVEVIHRVLGHSIDAARG